MGGEMLFFHHDKPIKNIANYEELVKNIVNDCQHQVVPVEFNSDRPTEILSENEKQRLITDRENLGTDDDYIIGVSLQIPENSENEFSVRRGHYHILFPKDPNAYKIISNMHARGFSGTSEIKRWIHDVLLKFVTTFPGVFELYYGDNYSGFDDRSIDVTYSNGRDYPVEKRWS
ncbi:uncharacterized protein LOC130677151 [Microplitis mediator]|uniref:uncharacterized protein LOC130677151 n=1 Tax=Microplitis mediator TaxID=375433 RepID=UPI0025571EE9|nr:uncharacterized protein LOC130677151 [Microplitis mediator]XP_057339770.1 uncharacterized protein LOC130677151 [Microplitis mediator]